MSNYYIECRCEQDLEGGESGWFFLHNECTSIIYNVYKLKNFEKKTSLK